MIVRIICDIPDTLLLSSQNKGPYSLNAETRTPTRSMILAMNSVQWSSSRERRKSFAVFHMYRTLSSHMVLASVFPQRRFSPDSRYMSATHSTSNTLSVVSWTQKIASQPSDNDGEHSSNIALRGFCVCSV